MDNFKITLNLKSLVWIESMLSRCEYGENEENKMHWQNMKRRGRDKNG